MDNQERGLGRRGKGEKSIMRPWQGGLEKEKPNGRNQRGAGKKVCEHDGKGTPKGFLFCKVIFKQPGECGRESELKKKRNDRKKKKKKKKGFKKTGGKGKKKKKRVGGIKRGGFGHCKKGCRPPAKC